MAKRGQKRPVFKIKRGALGARTRRRNRRAARKEKRKRAKRGVRKPPKRFKCDRILRDIVGQKTVSMPELAKLLWKYVKENNLQNPKDRRFVIPDKKLARLVGEDVKQLRGFGMMKYAKNHFTKIKDEETSAVLTAVNICLAIAIPIVLISVLGFVCYKCSERP